MLSVFSVRAYVKAQKICSKKLIAITNVARISILRFEDEILINFAGEDKSQIVQPVVVTKGIKPRS